jgi:thioredoxin 1
MAQPIHLSDASFEQEVIKSDLPVLIDFWAAWCGPCRMIAPVIDELANDFSSQAKICKLDVDNNQQTAMQFGIRSIPTILIFKGGEVVDTIVGAVPKAIFNLCQDLIFYLLMKFKLE